MHNQKTKVDKIYTCIKVSLSNLEKLGKSIDWIQKLTGMLAFVSFGTSLYRER